MTKIVQIAVLAVVGAVAIWTCVVYFETALKQPRLVEVDK